MNFFWNNKKNKDDLPYSPEKFYIISGSHNKPAVTEKLVSFFRNRKNSEGFLYTGYPLIGTVDGAFAIDAMLISKTHGLICFDIVESDLLDNYEGRQDDIFNKIKSYLLQYPTLISKRNLIVEPKIVTVAPRCTKFFKSEDYPVITDINKIEDMLLATVWDNNTYYNQLHSVIQSITSIRNNKFKRKTENENSRGSILKKLEDSIANLDNSQAEAVINTYDGVQRIRGLAGSGKTIVLALKVAYLHAINPEWNIAVTFNTRSLKNQFEQLITRFIWERTRQDPDWSKISILHAWGAAGDKNSNGIYYNFCKKQGEEYFTFGEASKRFSYDNAFKKVCALALNNQKGKIEPVYDMILIDEAQDFPAEFLTLCYELLLEPKRLVYAYDELQSLSQNLMTPPEELFGRKNDGMPVVPKDKYSDIILYKCYRNSRPLLATAHALGFGIYKESGLIQMFENSDIWKDIGYNVISGELKKGSNVIIERTEETSPKFLEELSPKNDIIEFKDFKSNEAQIEYLVEDIIRNIKEEELLPSDIIVINSNPLTTAKDVGKARELLFKKGYNSILAGISTSPDIFQEKDAITFTGIYRAKGNEAGMVYILNSQHCYGGYFDLARNRNILFTAITRSKAWVRILGYGNDMESLIGEYEKIKSKNYQLDFKYPTDEEMKKMNIINREIDPKTKKIANDANKDISGILTAIDRGDLRIEDLSPEIINKLKSIL